MHILSLVFAGLAILGMMVGFIPCLGWFNWLNVPFAVVALIISIICFKRTQVYKEKEYCKYAIIISFIAIIMGLLRLIVGGGIF
jgi:hypothetical protein